MAKTKEKSFKLTSGETTTRAVALGTGVLLAVGLIPNGSDSKASPDQKPVRAVTVQPGQTEWQVANQLFPDLDTRIGVENIEKALPDDAAHAGTLLQPGDHISREKGHVKYSPPESEG
jgi:hypothetical protein